MSNLKEDSPWVLLDIASTIYAVSCETVLSLEQLSTVTSLPAAPPEVRGVVKFRNKIIELLDTRVLLGARAIPEEVGEFCDMMDCSSRLIWLG